MYLYYAEDMAERHKALTMKDWVSKLDAFLAFHEYGILQNAGRIKAAVAKKFAEGEYAKFRVVQDREYVSDFDKTVLALKQSGKLPKEPNVPAIGDEEDSVEIIDEENMIQNQHGRSDSKAVGKAGKMPDKDKQ